MGSTPLSLTLIEDLKVVLYAPDQTLNASTTPAKSWNRDSGAAGAGTPYGRMVQLMSASLLVSLAKATATTVMTTRRIM